MFYDWSYKGSTYSAVVPLTNLFGLYQIPEPGQITLINLVLFQWRLKFDMKLKTSLPVIWLEILTQKSGLVRTQRTTINWSWFSKWSWNWFKSNPGSQTSGFQLDFRVETPLQAQSSQFQLDQLIETP